VHDAGGGTEVAVDFRYGHALASQPTYANYVANCADQRAAKDDPSPACVDAINKFTDETGTGGLAGSTYNIYDMCGDDGVEVPDESAPVIRADGAKGVYAPMNDIKPRANKRKQMSLDELFGDDDNDDAATSGSRSGVGAGDHQKGYGGLNNFPCGAFYPNGRVAN
jgi:hypothetical protein